MVYIQYPCDIAAGRLYRRSMAYNAGATPALTPDQTLLNNIVDNPGGTACFSHTRKKRRMESRTWSMWPLR